MIKLLLLVLCVQFAYGYHEGAPDSACEDMTPHHDVQPQRCEAKYIVQAEKTSYRPGEPIRITVRGATSDDRFKGILLTAKNRNNQQIVGTWSITNPLIRTVACGKRANTAVTHVSADDKQQVEAVWQSPATLAEGDTVIKATIVKSFEEIYVDCFNVTLTTSESDSKVVPPTDEDTQRAQSPTRTSVTLAYANNAVTVTMVSREVSTDQYRSIGFSDDQHMGNEYIFVCAIPATVDPQLRRMHTKPGKTRPLASNVPVDVIRAVYENGQATCEFSVSTNSPQAENETAPIVINKDYYIIFAAGMLRGDGSIAKHNFTFVSDKTYQLQTPQVIDLDQSMITTTTDPSGSTVTTTMAPQTNDVNVDVSWTFTAGVTNVSMQISNLKTSQWLAMGLSDDYQMGEDHVFICHHLGDGSVSLKRFVNPGQYSRPQPVSTLPNPGGVVTVTREKQENGMVYCDFTLSQFTDARRRPRQTGVRPLSQTATYHPLIAIGNLGPSDSLIKHSSTSRKALTQDVSLNRAQTFAFNADASKTDSAGLMKAHGIIMIFTWIVLVSTGILMARYFKHSWSERKICGKAVWFAVHRALMTSAALLTLISFVLILVYKKGQWVSQNNQREFAHSIIGILVISFATIQPLMALFRCNPDAEKRFIFNYAHATVGLSAFVLSVAAIMLAMFFKQFELHVNNEWGIVVAWSCWMAVIFVLFEVNEVYFRQIEMRSEKPDALGMYDRSDPAVVLQVEALSSTKNWRKNRIKSIFLLLHVIVALALALALMIIIGRL